jgi:tetratricopeptide (TPR) repeat protein
MLVAARGGASAAGARADGAALTERPAMILDRQSGPLHGATREGADLYDAAAEAFAVFRGDPVGLLDRAAVAAPEMAMAPLAKGWLFALATEPAATAAARGFLAQARGLPLGAREASHAEALGRLVAGEWTAAALALDRHQMRWPRDLLALQVGHLIDFFRANARDLRDRVARALPAWDGVPGRSWVLGMYAFGLEEAGDYARAEALGREAVATDPRDGWAHHAVAHVLEMEGRPDEGLGWMRDREPFWADEASFFRTHNWWHRALCHLERAEPAEALALYDGPIRAGGLALDLVDGAALLWRLDLSGVEVGARWAALSDAWEGLADGALYPFNDWHAAMAHLGAGRDDRVAALRRALAARTGPAETDRWARETGLPLIEGFAAFRRGAFDEAVARLHAARFVANGFGGSHAQRDVIDWTLAEAALRGGLRAEAVALARERLALRPHSPVNRGFLARAEGLAA